jgi:hypothetical protein
MPTQTSPRPRIWGIVILFTLMLVLPIRRLPAQESSCIAVDMNDMPRACTFLENHGACLVGALDSYYACREGAGGILDRLACEIGVQVDLLACNLGLPWRLIEAIRQ